MTRLVFLDTGVLGYVTHPRGNDTARACTEWLASLLDRDVEVCIPEICDYEIRREYLLNSSQKALQKLDELNRAVRYVPIATPVMIRAAELWAAARKQGKPTADPKELDVDVILAAQALTHAGKLDQLVIATTNVGHLSLFADARTWSDINP